MNAVIEKNISDVNKALRGYVKNLEGDHSGKEYYAQLTLDSFISDRMLIIQAIRHGLPFTLFEKIKELIPFNDSNWADVLEISTKSLQRYRNEKGHIFKRIHSEKIIELAEVTLFGLEVFGSSEKFHLWLNTPSFALGNLKPIELLKDSYGKELVMNELTRIDQGIFA